MKPACISFSSALSYCWLQHLWFLVLFLEKSVLSFSIPLEQFCPFPMFCWGGQSCHIITTFVVLSAGSLNFRSNWELPTTLIYSLGYTELDWPICSFSQTGLLCLSCKSVCLSFPLYCTHNCSCWFLCANEASPFLVFDHECLSCLDFIFGSLFSWGSKQRKLSL